MRIDLTQGAYRVLQRADLLTKPQGISIAAILCALFEETECRASQWLEDTGLKIEDFRLQFGLYEGLSDTLHSPISAPMFPVGSYGVPAGATTTLQARKDIAQGEQYAAIDGGKPDVRDFAQESLRQAEQPDRLTVTESPKTASHLIQPTRRKNREHSSLEWFVNEVSVRFSKVLIEVDHAILSILNRIHQSLDSGAPASVLGAGGMVLKITANPFPGLQESSFELATEHLLLAVALADDPLGAGAWIRSRGLDPTAVHEKIALLHRKQEDWEEPQPETEVLLEAESAPPPFSPSSLSPPLIRLLDAAANRAMEAIRVIEDYVRFMLDDPGLTSLCKTFRHELAARLAEIPQRQRVECRDTPGDVGTEISGSGEYCRASVEDVLASNFSRLQQSLRSLEEYGKMVSIPLSQGLERLRYQAYTLHKTIFQTARAESIDPTQSSVVAQINPRTLLQDALLYVLIDCRETKAAFAELVQALINAEVDVIQLRDKQADDRTLLERGKTLRNLTAESRTLFIVNDRPDLAKLTQADGVHVGQEELFVRQVRQIVGLNMLIGVSTHSVVQIRNAIADGADYIGVGPVFASATKSFTCELPGLELLKELNEEPPPIPAYAIGGITQDNLSEVLATGVNRVAVSSAITDSADPEEAARQLKQMLRESA